METGFSNSSVYGSALAKRSVYRGHYGRRIWGLRLGGPLQSRSFLSGGMDRPRLPGSHQQEGDHRRTQVHPADDGTGGLCPPLFGQHDSRVLHKPAGWDKVPPTMFGSYESLADSACQERLGPRYLGSERRQSVIRPTFQDSPADLGFFIGQGCGGQSVDPLVHTGGGRIRERGLSSGTSVLHMVPRPQGTGKRCLLSQSMARPDFLFSSNSSHPNDPEQDQVRPSDSNTCGPGMEVGSLVGHDVRHDGGGASQASLLLLHSGLSQRQGTEAALHAPSHGLPCVRGQDLSLLTDQAKVLIDQDVRPGTNKIYKNRFRIFSDYCEKIGHDPVKCPVEIVTNFLSVLKDRGMTYQTICGYRSAISRFHSPVGGLPVGSAPLIRRITKACFNQAPPIPKYSDMWDVDQLLVFLETLHPNADLSTFDLGMKAVALISSLSICRQSSVAVLAPQYQVVDNSVVIPLTKLEKTSRPGKLRHEVVLPAGDSHPPLSLNLVLSEYLSRTEKLREYYYKAEGVRPANLFVSNNKPYQAVQPCTLAKWLLAAMDRAGICTATYKANSVRSASASGMRSKGMSLSQVLQRGNWSESTRTFAIFYDRSGLS